MRREFAALGTLLLIGASACGGRATRDPADGAVPGGTGGRVISEVGGTGGRGGAPSGAAGEPLLVAENWRAHEDYGDRPVPYVVNAAIHGVDPNDLFIGGYVAPSVPQFGFIDHWTGESWVPFYETPHGSSNVIDGVWAASASQVFAAFSTSIVLTDGSNEQVWSFGVSITGIFGFGTDDVLAVGASGSVLHYDGSDWVQEASGTSENLGAVWGSGPHDVFAVGERGVIVRRGEAGWEPMSSPTSMDLNDVWGSGSTDVYAVGGSDGAPGHVVLHFDGRDWTVASADNDRQSVLLGVAGRSASDVCAVGAYRDAAEAPHSLILHFDGISWTEIPIDTESFLWDVWPRTADEYLVVGPDDTLAAVKL